jgi:hypothetical protein
MDERASQSFGEFFQLVDRQVVFEALKGCSERGSIPAPIAALLLAKWGYRQQDIDDAMAALEQRGADSAD